MSNAQKNTLRNARKSSTACRRGERWRTRWRRLELQSRTKPLGSFNAYVLSPPNCLQLLHFVCSEEDGRLVHM